MLSVYYVLVIVEMIVGIPYSFWVSFVDVMIGVAFCVHIASLTLYISDRKGFWNRRSGNKFASALVAILSLILIVENLISGSLSFYALGIAQAHSRRTLTWEESRVYILTLVLNVLGFLSGVVLLFDLDKMLKTQVSYRLKMSKTCFS